MSKIRKIITTGLIATTLVTAVVASTPASAWHRPDGWYSGWIWDTSAFAANVLEGLALGALSTGVGIYPYYPNTYGYYGYPAPVRSCVVRSPVYDDWGNFVGSQWLRVAC